MKLISKKWAAAAGVLTVIAFSTQIVQAADVALKAIAVKAKLFTGNTEVTLEKDAVTINGSLYVPVRAMGEALGQKVTWDNATKTLIFQDLSLLGKYTWTTAPSLGSGLKEGGFSGLTHLQGDPGNVFYTLADRGPNGQITIDKSVNRTLPVQNYVPRFYKIQLEGDQNSKCLKPINCCFLKGKQALYPKPGIQLD